MTYLSTFPLSRLKILNSALRKVPKTTNSGLKIKKHSRRKRNQWFLGSYSWKIQEFFHAIILPKEILLEDTRDSKSRAKELEVQVL